MGMSKFFVAVAAIFSISTTLSTPAMAVTSSIRVEVAESAFTHAFQALTKAAILPIHFDNSDGTQKDFDASCLAPKLRFPKAGVDTDLTPRVIVHFVCSFKSDKFKINAPCAYNSIDDVPDSEFATGARTSCAQIVASISPKAVTNSSTGTVQVTFDTLKLERLAVIPSSLSPALQTAFAPIEPIFTRSINQAISMRNPYFQNLYLLPLDFATSADKAGIAVTFKSIGIDMSARVLRIEFDGTPSGGTP